jgi:hypothetical protein
MTAENALCYGHRCFERVPPAEAASGASYNVPLGLEVSSITHDFNRDKVLTLSFEEATMSKILLKTLKASVLALFVCTSLLLIAPANAQNAQSVYGSIFGTVSDKTGGVIAGATVTATDESKGTVITVTSNGVGDYSVPHLVPDVYDLKVTATGFKAFETKGVKVQADTAPRIDPNLEVGGITSERRVAAGVEDRPRRRLNHIRPAAGLQPPDRRPELYQSATFDTGFTASRLGHRIQ